MGFILKDIFGKPTLIDREKFVLQNENGELVEFSQGIDTPNLQDKTITENGEYTADEGFDGLGKVLVDIVASNPNSTLKFYNKNHNISASLGERIEIDFGFSPDFILFFPASTLTHSSKYVLGTGISQKLADMLGCDPYISILMSGSSSVSTRNSLTPIDAVAYHASLYNVNSTGFNLGINYNFASGLYNVTAIGL